MALPSVVLPTHELLDAQGHVWNHIFNFINSMSLKCAIQLGIPDIIHKHGKPMTLSELAEALPINQSKKHGLYRLMRVLVHSRFFIKVKTTAEEESFWLTSASRLLLTDEPHSVAALALSMLDPTFMDLWHHTSEWFKNSYPTPYAATHQGNNLLEHGDEDPKLNQLLGDAMACDARFVTNILVKDCKQVFDGLTSMVDVGGGPGVVAKIITEACPGLKCVVLDVPQVVDGLEGNENVKFVAGDMFKSIPAAQAVILKWVMHEWEDEICVKILKKCKEAIPSKNNGGKVIILEMVVDDDNTEREHEAVETQLFFDMMMMTTVAGKERTEREWAKLFSDAGFTSYKIIHVLGLRSLIEVYP